MGVVDALVVTVRDGGVRFAVRAIPRAKQSGVDGVHAGALKVRITAPPVDGAANDAVIDVLALALNVPARTLRITGGAKSRTKVMAVDGLTEQDVRVRLGDALR